MIAKYGENERLKSRDWPKTAPRDRNSAEGTHFGGTQSAPNKRGKRLEDKTLDVRLQAVPNGSWTAKPCDGLQINDILPKELSLLY